MVERLKNLQYRGRLTASEVAAGINAASRNAVRLASDADTLLQAGSMASATALAILALEEVGKNAILRWVATADSDDELRRAWRAYQTHTMKSRALMPPPIPLSSIHTVDDIKPHVDHIGAKAAGMEELKQLAFYTDCIGEKQWSEPGQDVNDEAQTARFVESVQAVTREIPQITAEEIELWIKHMKPVGRQSVAWIKKAAANWHEEMIQLGLSDRDSEDFERLLWGEADGT